MPRYVFHSFDFGGIVGALRRSGGSERCKGSRSYTRTSGERSLAGRPGHAGVDRRPMRGKSCIVVILGSRTAGRRWVEYESCKAWADRKGVVGVRIRRLTDSARLQGDPGANPFARFEFDSARGKVSFDAVVPVYDPPYASGKTCSRA